MFLFTKSLPAFVVGVAVAAIGLGPAIVEAAEPLAPPASVDARLDFGGVVSNLDAGGELRLVIDLDRTVRLGLRTRALAVRETTIGGFAVDEGTAFEGLAFGSFRVARFGRSELRLHLGIGARGTTTPADGFDDSLRILTEVGPIVRWRPNPNWTIRIGWIQRTDVEVSPTTDVAVLGSVFRFGAARQLSARWALYAEGEVGGVFGYSGDNEKIQSRGVLGLRVHLDPPTASEPPAATEPAGVGAFVALEWRVLGLAGHVSHGPAMSAGLRLFDGRLRLGVTGFARPGPINPETFTVTPATGMPYKGQDELSLRSDGAYIGLLIESEWPCPGLPELLIIPGVSVGNAAFGFYLTGDDRETPDGRRVSAWEDELQDGRDAGVGIGIEPGLRLAWHEPGALVAPYLAGRYLIVVGYDAYAKDSYDGFSFGGGLEFIF